MELVGINKVCPQCGVEKDLSEYSKLKNNRSVYNDFCKICLHREGSKNYYQKNKDIIIVKQRSNGKKYYQKNKVEIAVKRKIYKENHKEEIYIRNNDEQHLLNRNKSRKKYYNNNKDIIIKKQSEKYHSNKKEINSKKRQEYLGKRGEKMRLNNRVWYSKNKESVQLRNKEYRKLHQEEYKEIMRQSDINRRDNGSRAQYINNKRKINIGYKIGINIRVRINAVLKRNKIRKNNKTLDLLGCGLDQLKQHLESRFIEGMGWNNFLNGKIHIDHIIPCSYFDLTIPENQKICFNYKNLQPMWAKDNIKKSNKLPENYLNIINEIKCNIK